MLLYIRLRLKESDWDHIVIQTYEPLSLFLSQCFKGAYIVDQNTASYVDSPQKRLLLKILSSKYKHVVFNEYQKTGLENNGIKNVYVVPIGAHVIPEVTDKSILREYSLEERKFIFCPSATSVDHEFVAGLCQNEKFLNFLSEKNLRFVVKKNYPVDDKYKNRILSLEGYISDEKYDCLMRCSSFVLLSYLKSFTYRVSGVLLECIESNIKCLINDLPSFRAYEKYIRRKDIFYNSVDDLINKANKIDELSENEMYLPFNSMDVIKKSWIETFKMNKK